jgi:hypothetical protein
MSMPVHEPMRENEKSGKRLILGVVAACLVAAAASWWFRYSATHRAAEFWGPQAVALIRDAPHVTLRSDAPSADGEGTAEADVPRDISQAKGLTHLRNALLEDASYDWTATAPAGTDNANSLVFATVEGGEPRAVVLFSPDFRWVSSGTGADPAKYFVATTEEFAAGLKKFFATSAADATPEQ